MKVLSLVTNRYSPFYLGQIKILENLGVNIKNVYPFKQGENSVSNFGSRTIFDYLPLYFNIIKESSKKYDLVHANYGLTAPFALAQPHRPLVLTLWGSDLRLFLNNRKWNWLCKNLIELEGFDEIMVRSEEMRINLKREFGLDAHIVPSGVDLDKFKPMEKEKAKNEVGWKQDVKHILFPYPPSRDVKNYSLAEEVVEEVKSRTNEKVELKVVYGVPHKKILVYYNASDVLLLTSKSEGSPNTVKEAMACNVPVVSTDVGDVELLLDGVKHSKVCDDKKKLVKGVLDAIDKNARSNGRERIKELGISLEDMGKKIFNIYNKALESYK